MRPTPYSTESKWKKIREIPQHLIHTFDQMHHTQCSTLVFISHP